jgi:hypothetical protein
VIILPGLRKFLPSEEESNYDGESTIVSGWGYYPIVEISQ